MKKKKPLCIGFNPGNYKVYIEFVTPKGNRYTGVHDRPYYTESEALLAVKDSLLQDDIIGSYIAQQLVPIYE